MSIFGVFLFFFLGGLEAFEGPKAAVLKVLGAVSLGLVVSTVRGRPSFASWTPVDFAAAGVLLAELITTAASDSPLLSVVGEPTQREGLLVFLALGGMFLAARLGTRTASDARAIVDALLLATAIAGAYGLVQMLRVDPVPWAIERLDVEGWRRPSATMGHPNLFGVATAMAAVAAASCAILSPARRPRHVALAALFSFLTLATLSRAALLAAVVAGGATAVLAVRASRSAPMTRRTRLVVAGAALLTLVGGAGIGPLRHRVVDALAGFSGSGATRLEIWRSALAAWRASPWLGHGPDTFALAFTRFQTPRYWVVEWGGIPSHAHSIYLHVLATRGLAGAVAYAAALVTLGIASRSAWRAGGEVRAASVPLVGAIASLLIAGGFGALGTSGVLALAVCAGALGSLGAASRPAPVASAPAASATLARRVFAPAALGAIALTWEASETLAWQDAVRARELASAVAAASNEDKARLASEARTLIRRAVGEMSADDRIRTVEAEVDLLAKDGSKDPVPVIEDAERAAREATRMEPLRSYAYEWLGVACMERARAGHAGSFADGVAAYERALALSPYGGLAMRKYAQYLLLLGHAPEGLAMMQRAASIYPDSGPVAWDLSRALAANNRLPEARATLERARGLSWIEGDPERDEVERAWKTVRRGGR